MLFRSQPILTAVRSGPVASTIVEEAGSLPADLIVVGTHGRTGFEHLMIGSVAERVLRRAVCPVLTVPRRAPDAVPWAAPLLAVAADLARLDVLVSLADQAVRHHWVAPEVTGDTTLELVEARHPVLERLLPPGGYVPNDLRMDTDAQRLLIVTGPNMSGKSALLRQTALITLMAHLGCFVPARSARIPLTDKIFTRVGASDNLSSGESTFLVEMNETASILNNLSDRSLIILDEIGRGTATYDGISLAWSIAEYLHNHSGHPLTLFATHYHELTRLADSMPRLRNWSVAVKEWKDEIVFVRRVVPGAADRSYGIQVAQIGRAHV